MESTTAVANLQVACPYRVRVDLGFYSGRARPIEVFKLVSDAPRLELRSHARRHAHRQARARTPNYHGPQTKLKVDVQ